MSLNFDLFNETKSIRTAKPRLLLFQICKQAEERLRLGRSKILFELFVKKKMIGVSRS